MQEVPEGRSKVGQRILLLVAEEVGGSGPEPGSQGAREPGSKADFKLLLRKDQSVFSTLIFKISPALLLHS